MKYHIYRMLINNIYNVRAYNIILIRKSSMSKITIKNKYNNGIKQQEQIY